MLPGPSQYLAGRTSSRLIHSSGLRSYRQRLPCSQLEAPAHLRPGWGAQGRLGAGMWWVWSMARDCFRCDSPAVTEASMPRGS